MGDKGAFSDIEETPVPYAGLNRTACDVLEEMRKCYKTHNYAPLLGLIEEAQIMGNRMESKLEDIKDYRRFYKARKQIRKEIVLLAKHREKLRDEIGKLAER